MAPATNSSLASLLSRSSLDDHEQLLQASEAVLKSSKSDAQAQHVKAVALLKLERYEEAVEFVEASGTDLKKIASLEYAYALYRSGRLADAARIASQIDGERGALHIEAQARYRLGEAEETAQIYGKIRQQQVPAEDHDLRINQGAIDALGQWSGIADSVKKPGREDLEAFETAYNAACGSIAKGQLAQAEILLKRAVELCKHSEDLTDEQKEEELLPILVQQTYVFFRQGKTTEAEAVAARIKIDEIEDLATRKIASNNSLLSSKLQDNPFLLHKAFHSVPKVPSKDQLFAYQSNPLISNEKTIDLQTFKYTGLVNSAKKHLKKYPDVTTEPAALITSAFDTAARARNEVGKAAINLVLPHLERHPTDIGLIMTLVQLYTLTGNTTSGIELIESLFRRLETSTEESEKEVRYHPGLVSILISLYRLQGRRSHIRQELAKSASFWRHKSKPPITLLRAAGVVLLASSAAADVSAASKIFLKLFEEQPDDQATIAGYVASRALADQKSVENLAKKLTPIPKLIGNVDVDALEAAGIPQSSNAIAIAASAGRAVSRKRASDKEEGSQAKRIRRSRLPKNLDAASDAKPDPERWLPMRDRSYYRAPKSKKKGRKGDDRTQGGNVNEDLDVSKSGQAKGGEVVSGGGGGGGKKKKGRGKK